MFANGLERPFGSVAHHIVAFADKRAVEARAILEKAGININDAVNGIYLPGTKISQGSWWGCSSNNSALMPITDEVTRRLQQSDDVQKTLSKLERTFLRGDFRFELYEDIFR